MNYSISLLILLSIMLIQTSCKNTKNSTNQPIVTVTTVEEPTKGLPLNSQWILESINTPAFKNKSISKSSFIIIDATMTSYTGNGGCNSIGGKIVHKDSELKFESGFSTQKACDFLDQEQVFIDLLLKTTHYKINGGQLSLFQNKELLMTLESYR